MRQQFDQAKEASERAIELNPSDAQGYASLGVVRLYSGDISGAIQALETARAYDPIIDYDAFALALAYYLADRPEDVIKYVEGRVGRQGRNGFTYVVLSMAYAEIGKRDEAADVAGLARRRNPAIDAEQFGTLLRDPAHREKVRAGLKKAGWL
jgi:tetratricopeptide (TPR) repeat protein